MVLLYKYDLENNLNNQKKFDDLQQLVFNDLKKVDINILVKLGLIKKANNPVKILGKGEITKSIEISADMFSKTAIEKIEKAGGKVIYQ